MTQVNSVSVLGCGHPFVSMSYFISLLGSYLVYVSSSSSSSLSFLFNPLLFLIHPDNIRVYFISDLILCLLCRLSHTVNKYMQAFLLWKLISDHLTGEQLGFFAMCLANTWGLVLLILMLGYGLVEVPRVTWYSGNRVVAMKKLHYTLAHLHEQAQVSGSLVQLSVTQSLSCVFAFQRPGYASISRFIPHYYDYL